MGKKSHDYFKRRDYNIIDSYRDFWNTLDIGIALKIGEEVEKFNQFGQVIDEVDINDDSKKN